MYEKKISNIVIRGFRRIIILKLLRLKPIHGYNLMKEYKRITGKRLYSSGVYPFLHALEEEDYILGTWMNNGSRRIKIYEMTQKGKILLASIKARLNEPLREIVLDLLSSDGKKGRLFKK